MNAEQTVKIVLAEDQRILLDGLVEILKQEASFEVVGQAVNGKQALNLIEQERPDLAILDIDMPVMSGIEVSKVLKETYPEIKILILSMYKKKMYVDQLMKLGVNGYMLKERGREELATAIKAIMSGERYLGERVREVMIEIQYPDPNKPKVKEVLTKREREILILVAKGRTTPQIASRLFLADKTVNTHRRNIRGKLNIKDNGATNFLKYALQHGYMRIEDIGDESK